MKVCNKCKIEKELTEFAKNKGRKDGHESQCKSCRYKREKETYEQRKDKRNERRKKHLNENTEELNKKRRDYHKANKEELNKKRRARYKNDPFLKLTKNIRSLISKSFSRGGWKKNTKTQKILGCDFATLEQHLNDNLYGFMIGEDGLDIDHIIPLATTQTEEDVIRLNHYTNLQLLPSAYNQFIKSDKPWDEKHFENWLLNL